MTRQTDNPDVVCHVFAAELGTEADLAGFFPDLFLQFNIAEGASGLVAAGGQIVVILAGSEFDRQQVALSRSAADDERDVIRRAGRGAEGLHFAHKERDEGSRIEDGLGLLVEVALVGAAAALGHTEETILHAFGRLDVDLGGQVAFCIDFLVHRQRGILAVTKVLFGVGLEDTFRKRFLIAETGPDLLAFLAVDDGSTCILAERKLAFTGHLGVSQHRQGDVFVVFRRFRIGEDLGHLRIVRRTEHERHITESGVRQDSQRLGRHFQHRFAFEITDRDPRLGTGDLVVLGGILAELEHRSVFEFHSRVLNELSYSSDAKIVKIAHPVNPR